MSDKKKKKDPKEKEVKESKSKPEKDKEKDGKKGKSKVVIAPEPVVAPPKKLPVPSISVQAPDSNVPKPILRGEKSSGNISPVSPAASSSSQLKIDPSQLSPPPSPPPSPPSPPSPPKPKILFSTSSFFNPLKMEEDDEKIRDALWMEKYKLTHDRLCEIKESFVKFEKENDCLPEAKFGSAMRAIGQNPTEAEVKSLLSQVELNAKGFVPMREYVRLVGTREFADEGDMHKNLEEAFKFFDKEGHGLIRISDLRDALTRLGEPFDEAELADFLKVGLQTTDGRIVYSDFYRKLVSK